MSVFVLDKKGTALMPCSEKRARLLLERGRARVHRVLPFVIRLVDRSAKSCEFQEVQIKLDPGSKSTGIGLVRTTKDDCVAVLSLFDTQQMDNPEISGVEYSQGTLAGFEQREYILEKWGRKCAYCDVKDVPLNLDHIHSRANGGSNRESNLTLACIPCNQKKGAMLIELFLAKQPERLQRILSKTKTSLKDVSAVNSTRLALYNALKETGLPVETSTGGTTKWNRSRLAIPKTHALDAICVGNVESVTNWQRPVLKIRAMGRGCYQRTRLTAYGFPRGYLPRTKQVKGFQTGDMAKAVVPTGKKAGTYVGRIAVRTSGNFNIQTPQGLIQGISHRHCKIVQRGDGYGYQQVAFMEDVYKNPQKTRSMRTLYEPVRAFCEREPSHF